MEKVDHELFWVSFCKVSFDCSIQTYEAIKTILSFYNLQAEGSDILSIQVFFYAFEMHRHNWRKAASHMDRYRARLRTENTVKDNQQFFLSLQERLNWHSAAINDLIRVK